jgi:hypothetical protein
MVRIMAQWMQPFHKSRETIARLRNGVTYMLERRSLLSRLSRQWGLRLCFASSAWQTCQVRLTLAAASVVRSY